MRILRGNPDDDGPADNTCHCEMRATCFPEGGVPTLPPFLTCLFCQKMGGLKNNWPF